VLALAGTAIRFADSPQSEAEHWLRILRMHGEVGSAMQALGVGEKPLNPADASRATQRFRRGGGNIVELARARAAQEAIQRGAGLVGTVHVLHAVGNIYGSYFEEVLYSRGPTLDELKERLAGAPDERSAVQHG
jgi:hypothetical protein